MSENLINLKERLVYCPRCRKDSQTAAADPRCDVCGGALLTVIYDVDGKRLTGRADV